MEIEGAVMAWKARGGSSAGGSRGKRPTEFSIVLPSRILKESGLRAAAVGSNRTLTIPVTHENMRMRQVLEQVAEVLRLPLFRETWELLLSEADQARVQVSERVVPLQVSAGALLSHGIGTLQLRRREFFDAPSQSKSLAPSAAAAGASGSRPLTSEHGASPSRSESSGGRSIRFAGGGSTPVGFHNIHTASAFDTWRLIKVNRHGRRQDRIMGMDLRRITNEKVPDKHRWRSAQTHTSSWLITDIARVVVGDPEDETERNRFSITFRTERGEQTVMYEAQSAQQREDILGKLTYILEQFNEGQKVRRLGRRR